MPDMPHHRSCRALLAALKLSVAFTAAQSVEALPVGNGRLGAMVFGGFEIGLQWQNGALRRATVRFTRDTTVRLRAGAAGRTATLKAGDLLIWEGK